MVSEFEICRRRQMPAGDVQQGQAKWWQKASMIRAAWADQRLALKSFNSCCWCWLSIASPDRAGAIASFMSASAFVVLCRLCDPAAAMDRAATGHNKCYTDSDYVLHL